MNIIPPVCPYCQRPSVPATGLDIYPDRPDLSLLKFFRCIPCDARVGTHKADGRPLGTLANANLRRLRNQAHAAFDPLWQDAARQAFIKSKAKDKKFFTFQAKVRKELYAWLTQSMGLRDDECHIAMFNEDQCRLVMKLCRERALPA